MELLNKVTATGSGDALNGLYSVKHGKLA